MKKDVFNRKKIRSAQDLEKYLNKNLSTIFNAQYKNGQIYFDSGDTFKLHTTQIHSKQR